MKLSPFFFVTFLDFFSWNQSIEVEETFEVVSNRQGVVGAIVLSRSGVAVKSTFNEAQTALWSSLVGEAITQARTVGQIIETTSNLTMLRIRSSRHEVMIAPEKDFILMVIHKQLQEN